MELQRGAVGEQEAAQGGGAGGAVDGAAKAGATQAREEAAVIEVGVGQDDRVELRRLIVLAAVGRSGRGQEGRTVSQAQLLETLIEAAVDEHAGVTGVEEIPGAGDGAGGAEEGQREGACGHGAAAIARLAVRGGLTGAHSLAAQTESHQAARAALMRWARTSL